MDGDDEVAPDDEVEVLRTRSPSASSPSAPSSRSTAMRRHRDAVRLAHEARPAALGGQLLRRSAARGRGPWRRRRCRRSSARRRRSRGAGDRRSRPGPGRPRSTSRSSPRASYSRARTVIGSGRGRTPDGNGSSVAPTSVWAPGSMSIVDSHSQARRGASLRPRITLVSLGCEVAARRDRRRGCPRRRAVATVVGWPCGHLPKRVGVGRPPHRRTPTMIKRSVLALALIGRSGRLRRISEPVGAVDRQRAVARRRRPRARPRSRARPSQPVDHDPRNQAFRGSFRVS